MKKKICRFICALAVMLSLILVSSAEAWAKEEVKEPLTLEYSDISDKVIKDNKNLEMLQKSMPLLTDAKKDIEDAKKEAKKAAAAGGGSMPSLPDTSGANPNELALFSMIMGVMGSMGSMASSFSSGVDIDEQIDSLALNTAQVEAALINGAKQAFYGYHALQAAMEDIRHSRSLLEESLALAKTQLNAGLGTPLAVKQAELSLAELDSGLAQMSIQCENLLNGLKLAVGCPQEQELVLGALPEPEREFLAAIDLAADTALAKENSFSLRAKELEHKHTTATRQRNLIKISIEAQTEQVALTVSTQYNKLLEANNTLLLEEQRLAVAEDKVKQARLQHQLGLLADLALNAEENAYQAQQDAVDSAMNSLFWEIESYKAIISGLN